MAFVSDFTKDPEQIVLDLINNDNTTTITEAQVTFGLPSAAPGETPPLDTQLTLTAVALSGYTGSQTVTYNRVPFSTVPGSRSTTFALGAAVNISDLVTAINAAYQLNLQPADFVDGALPTFTDEEPGETLPFDLVAGEDSLVFSGTVSLLVQRNDIALSSVITTTALSGLVYTQPA